MPIFGFNSNKVISYKTDIYLPLQSVPNIQRYRISYQAKSDPPIVHQTTTTKWQQIGLVLGLNYSITISASMDFRNFIGGNCYSSYLYGEESDPVYVVTQESRML